MSLRVWLPLNGSLENQGLSDINLNATPTYATGGKIGNQCLASQLGWFAVPDMANKKQMSFAYWVKINTATSTNWLDTFSWYSTNGSTNHRSRQEFYTNSTQTGVWFQGSSIGTTFRNTVGDWNHYVFTIDYDKGEAKFYINGEELSTPSLAVDTTHYIKGTGSAFLLRENGLDSHINDFRLYDHVLSPQEVKKISQGLVLHYLLNRRGFGQENLILNSKDEKTGKSNTAQWFRWSISNTPLTSNKIFTLSFDAKMSVASDVFYIGWALSDSTQEILQQGIQVSTEYHRYVFSGQTSKTNINAIIISNYKGYGRGNNSNTTGTLYIKNIKLEEGSIATPWCPNSSDALTDTLGLNNNIEYDTSGYKNNGTKINELTYTSDTPKYNVSTIFNGSNNAIKINENNWATQGMQEITINTWAYAENWASQNKLFSCTESGGFNTESGSSGYLRVPFNVYTNEAKTSSAYKYDSKEIKVSDLASGWHMFTIIYDSTGVKTYIDGTLHHTYTNTSYGIHFNMNARLFLGCEAATASPSSPYFNGKMSDFRIYTTALSAEDVLSLYQNEAVIESDGTIRGKIR